MTNLFHAAIAGRLARAAATIWVLVMGALMATLVMGPTPAADATTPSTVSVIPNASGAKPLLTATRQAGAENRFTFTTANLHVNPLPSSSAPQFVQVDWMLQKAVPGTTLAWTTVAYANSNAGLYTVALDEEDGESYYYVPLSTGKDVVNLNPWSRVVSSGAEAYRVVTKVTWTDKNTRAVLGQVTLTPAVAGDLSCQATTRAHCWVNDIYPDPRQPYLVLR